MNSSPPPPSFTLPPLRSNGQYPVTPEESPDGSSGDKDAGDYVSVKDKGKGKAEDAEVEASVRVSMYVRLFEGTSHTWRTAV
jgi:Fanconi-associated nuclease 1